LTFIDCLKLTVCDILLPRVCLLFCLFSVLKLIKGNLLTYLVIVSAS